MNFFPFIFYFFLLFSSSFSPVTIHPIARAAHLLFIDGSKSDSGIDFGLVSRDFTWRVSPLRVSQFLSQICPPSYCSSFLCVTSIAGEKMCVIFGLYYRSITIPFLCSIDFFAADVVIRFYSDVLWPVSPWNEPTDEIALAFFSFQDLFLSSGCKDQRQRWWKALPTAAEMRSACRSRGAFSLLWLVSAMQAVFYLDLDSYWFEWSRLVSWWYGSGGGELQQITFTESAGDSQTEQPFAQEHGW